MTQEDQPGVEDFAAGATLWLRANARPRPQRLQAWGQGSDDKSIFAHQSPGEEQAGVEAAQEWQRRKWEAGFGAISWPVEQGGMGLSPAHERAFRRAEAAFDVPRGGEALNVTLTLMIPTIQRYGTPEQQRRFLPSFGRADQLCCQLFSEPDAGSDLASLRTTAAHGGSSWVLSGEKLWCSGAPFCQWGVLIARTSSSAQRHHGLTAFLVPMDAEGVHSRPIRHMAGGSSFHAVVLDDVSIGDDLRLGEVGDGWGIAMAVLGFERGGAARLGGGSYQDVVSLAQSRGRTDDPRARQDLASLYVSQRTQRFLAQGNRRAGDEALSPAARGSMAKLRFTEHLGRVGDVAGRLLGAGLTADTGEWGTYGWSGHILGVPGTRIAGGTDEIQRNIIAERGLGLPR